MKKVIIKTNRLNAYKEGEVIILDEATNQKILYTLIENGEAELIDDDEDIDDAPEEEKEVEEEK